MKRILFLLAVFAVPVLFHSCTPEDDTVYDETLLYGKWVSGTLYYEYLSNHNGRTWNPAEDINEDEAQRFTWTLVKSELTQIHILETTGEKAVPKTYTVTQLTATTLTYKDSFNKSSTFTKTN